MQLVSSGAYMLHREWHRPKGLGSSTMVVHMAACARAGARMRAGLRSGGRRAKDGKGPEACDLWPGGKGCELEERAGRMYERLVGAASRNNQQTKCEGVIRTR